jgi:hypothetical protein
MTILFTKEGCGKCDWVKSNVDLSKVKDLKVFTVNGDDPEALAMLAYYECVALSEKKLPILVSRSKEIITGAGHIRKFLLDNCTSIT